MTSGEEHRYTRWEGAEDRGDGPPFGWRFTPDRGERSRRWQGFGAVSALFVATVVILACCCGGSLDWVLS